MHYKSFDLNMDFILYTIKTSSLISIHNFPLPKEFLQSSTKSRHYKKQARNFDLTDFEFIGDPRKNSLCPLFNQAPFMKETKSLLCSTKSVSFLPQARTNCSNFQKQKLEMSMLFKTFYLQTKTKPWSSFNKPRVISTRFNKVVCE